mgnify:CR=1 FL=1
MARSRKRCSLLFLVKSVLKTTPWTSCQNGIRSQVSGDYPKEESCHCIEKTLVDATENPEVRLSTRKVLRCI